MENLQEQQQQQQHQYQQQIQVTLWAVEHVGFGWNDLVYFFM